MYSLLGLLRSYLQVGSQEQSLVGVTIALIAESFFPVNTNAPWATQNGVQIRTLSFGIEHRRMRLKMKQISAAEKEFLGVIPAASSILEIGIPEGIDRKNLPASPLKSMRGLALKTRRYICSDGLLFVPFEKQHSNFRSALAASGMIAASAGGLLTVGLLTPLYMAANQIKTPAQLKSNPLTQIAQIIAFEETEPEQCIIIPSSNETEIQIEKQTFSIFALSNNPYMVCATGRMIVFGSELDNHRVWWDEKETTNNQLRETCLSMFPKLEVVGKGGFTASWGIQK